ncbi:MAG TPA: hypothetical protein PKH07_12320, partial [bacterium]|nr:hypothetical protein [bacterium]
MKSATVLLLLVLGIAVLVCSARAGLFGSDGRVGSWRGCQSLVESPTGEHLIFCDVSSGTHTLSGLWNGGGGGLGPYLRDDQADIMRAATASLTIDATTPEASQPILTLCAQERNLAVFNCSGELWLNGYLKQPSGVVRQFGDESDEYWDSDEKSLTWRVCATPAAEVDFDDRYLGVRGGIGAHNYTILSPDSGTVRFFENGGSYTEYWDATENALSLRASATPAASVDLDNGNMSLAGNLSLMADRKVTQPEDTTGNGPFILSGLVRASLSGFTVNTQAACYFTTTTGSLVLGAIPEEIYGGVVVVDDLVIHGCTGSLHAYIDSVELRHTDRVNSSFSVVTYTTDIGNDTDG